MSRARDIADFADGNITSATITNLVSTSASVNTANLIQSSVSSKPLIIKSTAPQTGTITAATVSSGSVTYSIASASTIFSVNDLVTITGISPDTLNDTRATVGAVSASSITIFNGRQGTYSSGGTATRIHANLLEIQNSAGTALSTIRSDGSTTGGFNSGLTLLNTTTFSGVSSQSVNDVFSATYTHYKITGDITGSTGLGVSLRLRVSGADNSSSNYRRQRLSIDSTTVNAERTTTDTSWLDICSVDTGVSNLFIFELLNPFQTQNTSAFSMRGAKANGNAEFSILWYGINVTTSYTGFTLLPNTGTITGSVSVYGYNK
jgi:hypothetical protein